MVTQHKKRHNRHCAAVLSVVQIPTEPTVHPWIDLIGQGSAIPSKRTKKSRTLQQYLNTKIVRGLLLALKRSKSTFRDLRSHPP